MKMMKIQKQMMKRQLLVAAMLSCCGLAVQAQSVYDVNHDGKVNVADATRIVDVVMGKIPDATDPSKGIIDVDASAQNLNAITIWKDGVPTIIYAPDKVYLWNTENEVPEIYDADYEPSEPTATEQMVMKMTNDETTAPVVPFSAEETQKYDAMAQDVIAKFLGKASVRSRAALPQEEYEELDPLAQKVIRTNGNNIFEGKLDISQAKWNSGRWGKTRYAADGEFENFYNTYYDDQGRRCLLIVFYHKGGFPNNKLVAVKMGQVNSGVVMDQTRPISAGSEYGYVPVCIDEYLDKESHGRMTLFPLMMTEMPGVAEKTQWPRWYLNPFVVTTIPEIPNNWKEFVFDEEFGKIDGVSLNCNTSYSVDPISGGFDRNTSTLGNQCTELCANYAKTIYQVSSSYTKGSAHEWPDMRRPETIDKDGKKVKAWIVIPNDGKRQVREGDFIVWEHPSGTKGHIAVVIETASDRIWVAHQNGGVGDNAWPIGTCLALENRVVKDHMPKTAKSPIYTNSIPITYIIRKNHSAEDENNEVSDYIPKAMKVSTSKMDFGKVNVGEEVVWSFTVKNTGFPKPLHVSSISVKGDQVFSVENFSACDIDFDQSRTYNVVFKPTRGQEFSGTIIIESDADDNPVWNIQLSGIGEGEPEVIDPTPVPTPVPVDDRFLIHTHQVAGVTYSLYKKADKSSSRTNADGWKTYKSDLTLDITKNGYTNHYSVNNDLYLDEGENKGQTPCIAIDLNARKIYIFTNSKSSGGGYTMDGYCFVSSLDNISFKKETVFTYANDGWFAFFVYYDGKFCVRHFRYAGYYAMEAVRNANGSWSNNTISAITPSNFERSWTAHGTMLIIE